MLILCHVAFYGMVEIGWVELPEEIHLSRYRNQQVSRLPREWLREARGVSSVTSCHYVGLIDHREVFDLAESSASDFDLCVKCAILLFSSVVTCPRGTIKLRIYFSYLRSLTKK